MRSIQAKGHVRLREIWYNRRTWLFFLYGGLWQMQCTQKPPTNKRRFYTSPRVLCILGFVFTYLVVLTAFAPSALAASLSAPGGNVADPVVRQVDIARPAVVRILTQIGGQLTVHFNATVSTTFPLSGS